MLAYLCTDWLTVGRSDGWDKQPSCFIVNTVNIASIANTVNIVNIVNTVNIVNIVNIVSCYLAFTFYHDEEADAKFHVIDSATTEFCNWVRRSRMSVPTRRQTGALPLQ